MSAPAAAEQFADLDAQRDAAHLGMWLFLASEVLLFAGLFALYAAYRAEYPEGFRAGVAHAEVMLGSANTAVLLTSSYAVASGLHALRQGRRGRAAALVALAVALGLVFLTVKGVEYARHFDEGIYPGGRGRFFEAHREPGLAPFFTLYFIATGLHAVHVFVGASALSWLGLRVALGRVAPPREHPLALGAMYWHLVDLVWVFLWPMFYLMGRG